MAASKVVTSSIQIGIPLRIFSDDDEDGGDGDDEGIILFVSIRVPEWRVQGVENEDDDADEDDDGGGDMSSFFFSPVERRRRFRSLLEYEKRIPCEKQ